MAEKSTFLPIISSDDWQIVEESHTQQPRASRGYQSEAEMEERLVADLSQIGYEAADITTTEQLIANLRRQVERLNSVAFTDAEWERLYGEHISNPRMGAAEKTRLIHDGDAKVSFRFDDGEERNVCLLDRHDIHRNRCQVIHQFVEGNGTHLCRYDVTILVNGLPLVHIELKRRGEPIRKAFAQIGRYARDAFLAGDRLYEYVQMFVISNGTDTRYYANTSRQWEMRGHEGGLLGRHVTDADGFRFTTRWADRKNVTIRDIEEVTRTLLTKRVLLPMLFRYSVLTVDGELRIMRPYQVTQVERMVQRVIDAMRLGRDRGDQRDEKAGGYIWSTTGSGKTLTSYKAAQLMASGFPCKADGAEDDSMGVDKVLFVVDRKDLDDQTVREYNKFEEGCVDGNRTTRILQRQLEDRDAKGNPKRQRLVVTTIQKLANFVAANPSHAIRNRRVVIIFDECHRSQFGKMHAAIGRFFRRRIVFGLTGTPIFPENAPSKTALAPVTTGQLFGPELHRYTIVDAIRDETVLKFNMQVKDTFHVADDATDAKVPDIDRKGALSSPERIRKVCEDILANYDRVCKRGTARPNSVYLHKVVSATGAKSKVAMSGFNAILCCDSVASAIRYYDELRCQIDGQGDGQGDEGSKRTVAAIFTFAANEEAYANGILPDETLDVGRMDASSRDALDRIMGDYNERFGTAFTTDGDSFDRYYRDVCRRMKNREIDILVVVNMLLTGFDAKCLGTLYIDKNLRQHGLIQAASRTNRIYNRTKNAGQIVCYRDLTQEMDDALALFGDPDAGGIVLLRSYDDYYWGWDDPKTNRHSDGYAEMVAALRDLMPSSEVPIGEGMTRDFVRLMGRILRRRNVLLSFDRFEQDGQILDEDEMQNYLSTYHDASEGIRESRDDDAEDISDDLVFEIELVRNIVLDLDYILSLVMGEHKSKGHVGAETRQRAATAARANPDLRDKMPLILSFVDAMNAGEAADDDSGWTGHVEERLAAETMELCERLSLRRERVEPLVRDALDSGTLRLSWARVATLMRDDDLFGDSDEQAVRDAIEALFERYVGLA